MMQEVAKENIDFCYMTKTGEGERLFRKTIGKKLNGHKLFYVEGKIIFNFKFKIMKNNF